MSRADLNLLYTLEVLLAENSVAGAARRLQLSPSAMSRSLARLRTTLGDPLLVRAGRGLVPSPRAIELQERVRQIVHEAKAALRPAAVLDLHGLKRTFTLRTRDGFVQNFGPAIVERVAREAPGVKLRFVPKVDKESTPLREGSVDLETGVVGRRTGPELRASVLLSDRFVGVVRDGHVLTRSKVSSARYLAARHVLVSRGGGEKAALDEEWMPPGLRREATVIVGSFSEALALARSTDLVASVSERHSGVLREGLFTFALPFSVPPVTVSLLWHPRMDGDPAHRWLRGCVREAVAAVR